MPSIYSFTDLLPFTTGELATNIDDSIHLLSDSYEYSQDQTIATFYANVDAPFTGDVLIINLLQNGTLVTSLETETTTTRFSFLVDTSDLAADDYSVEIYYTTSDLTGGDTFDLSAGSVTSLVESDEFVTAEELAACEAEGPIYCNGAVVATRTYCAVKSRYSFPRRCPPTEPDAPNSLAGLKL